MNSASIVIKNAEPAKTVPHLFKRHSLMCKQKIYGYYGNTENKQLELSIKMGLSVGEKAVGSILW